MLPVLALLSSLGAHAADWSDFSGAFPITPCPDGWVACVIGGATVDPEPRPDDTGAPTPADLRVSWFDLDARPGFDPFARLSLYPQQAPAPPAPPAPPTVEGDDDDGVAVVEGRPPTADPLPDPAPSLGVGPTPDPAPDPPPGDDDGVAMLPDLDPDPPAPPPARLGCPLDDDLFGRAINGRLTEAERSCLDEEVRSAHTLTQRGKASRPLISDAFARRDTERWARLVKRHLDEIERSDPAMAMAYARHLARGGQANAEGVLYWTDVALENRTVWQGDTYVKRTLTLRRMKATAAGARWQALEKAKAAGEAVDPGKLEKWRTDTRTFAKEWYDYSVSAGKPDDRGLALCASAARSDDACR